MIKQTYRIIGILLGVWLTACQDYDDPVSRSSVVDGNRIEVSIKTGVPAITVKTKADATEAENKLEHVDVLVFEVDKEDPDKETFAYLTTNSNTLAEPDINNEVEIKVKLNLSEDNEKYRLVFIANLKDEVEGFFSGNEETYKNKTKQELLGELTFIQEEIWTDEETDARPLPMWGENSKPTAVTKDMSSTAFGNLNLLRSVARIELSVSISGSVEPDGSDQFELKSVRVYNAREKGLAAPDTSKIANGEAKLPTLVSNSPLITEGDKSRYMVPDNAGNKVTGIYINEASNHVDNGDEVFLVIGAIYKNSNKVTYYKVGFYDAEDEPVDILRNFTYNMIVTSVSGEGEDTEEDAVNSVTSNLTVSMTEWSGGEYKYVIFNGKYYLAVSESEFTLPKQAGEYELKVKTNYPDGWKAKVSKGDSWLKDLNPDSGIEETVSFNVTENGDTERQGEISFSCGGDHLSLEVIINQTTKKEYTLNITIDDQDNIGSYIEFDKTITFTSGIHEYYETHPIPPRTLKVTWTPKEDSLHVNFNPYFDWDNEETDITYIEPGYAEITVKPKRLTERTDFYPEAVGDIQIHVGDETSTAQNILIRRRHHEVYVEKADLYLLDGERHSFQLYSNTKWRLFQETAEGDTLFNYFEDIDMINGGYTLDHEDGLTIGFKLKKGSEVVDPYTDSKSISKDLTVRIGFIDAGVDEEGNEIEIIKEYPIRVYYDDLEDDARMGDEANCYVLQAGGRGVAIPVSQANRSDWNSANHIPINATNLEVQFIWTDHPNGFDKDKDGKCPVKSAKIDYTEGNGPKARLVVEPGSEPGNAVIAVKSGNTIHWSWHIWVVDESENFDPYASDVNWPGFRYYEFLDRNLGALKEDPLSRDSWGLYYQWGRKDPFSISGTGSSTGSNMYDANGTLITWAIERNESANSQSAMKYSIEHPEKFMSPTGSTNWLATLWTANLGDDLWSETDKDGTFKKGIFDPCPEGWKTIPGGRSIANEWTALFGILEYVESGGYSYSWVSNQNTGRWPHAGHINQNGQHTITTTSENEGRYWTGTNNEFAVAWHSRMQFSKNQSNASEAFNKSSGLSVRCMRRVDK